MPPLLKNLLFYIEKNSFNIIFRFLRRHKTEIIICENPKAEKERGPEMHLIKP
jgi:hypothetical protein